MTARRLAALNHGSIRTPIPGQEVAEVVRRLRSWASQVAELRVGTEDDPTVRLQLVGVDLSAILDRVAHVDSTAARRGLIRDLLLRELGVHDTGQLELEHPGRRRATSASTTAAAIPALRDSCPSPMGIETVRSQVCAYGLSVTAPSQAR